MAQDRDQSTSGRHFACEAAIVSSARTSTQRLVLFVLLGHARNDDLTCYPSVATIAAEAALGERTVQTALADLEECGWISRSRSGRPVAARRDGRPAHGGEQPTVYTLQMPGEAPTPRPTRRRRASGAQQPHPSGGEVQQSHPSGVQMVREWGAAVAPSGVQQSHPNSPFLTPQLNSPSEDEDAGTLAAGFRTSHGRADRTADLIASLPDEGREAVEEVAQWIDAFGRVRNGPERTRYAVGLLVKAKGPAKCLEVLGDLKRRDNAQPGLWFWQIRKAPDRPAGPEVPVTLEEVEQVDQAVRDVRGDPWPAQRDACAEWLLRTYGNEVARGGSVADWLDRDLRPVVMDCAQPKSMWLLSAVVWEFLAAPRRPQPTRARRKYERDAAVPRALPWPWAPDDDVRRAFARFAAARTHDWNEGLRARAAGQEGGSA